MKSYIWLWCMINTSLIILSFVFVATTKDFGEMANNRCDELEKELALQKERCDYLSRFVASRDSIVINLNYNEKKVIVQKKEND